MAIKLADLAVRIGATLRGDPQVEVSRMATLQQAGSGDLSFLSNPRYRRYLASTAASAVIIGPDDTDRCPVNALVAEAPYVAYAKAAALLDNAPPAAVGRHPAASVDPASQVAADAHVAAGAVVEAGARIGDGAFIGPGCVVQRNAVIGPGSRLAANVTVCHGVTLGSNVLVHPGAVIGSDGFGLANDGGVWIKIPQLGSVVIGGDVEIGANTTIDRGALDDTRIGNGVKLDNQIQIAHNVVIGDHTAIAACVGIAGSAEIGRHCAIGGGVGILGHLTIADHVQITAMSLVTHSIDEPGVYSSGTPLEPNQRWHRNFVRFKQLDHMARRLKALEKAIGSHGRNGNDE